MKKFIIIVVEILILFKSFISANSDLVVIEQNDPDDNSKGITYDTLNFLSRITTNAQYFLPIEWYSPRDCSGFQNSGFMYSTYYTYDPVPKNEECLGRARNCITYRAMPENTESYRYEIFGAWMRSLFGYDTEYYRIQKWKIRKPWCPICRCYCDNSNKPSVAMSVCLDVISSNVKEGYVVTGVRFRIVDRVLRLQIRQGKLTDDNIIDPETVDWQMINNCKSMKNMSFDYRALQMDDMILPEEYFVTGFSFRNNDKLGRFVLSIFGKRLVDLKNININATEYWRPSDNRVDLMTPDMNIPITAQKKNTELSTPNKNYVSFQLPNFRLDIADDYNALMPFLDIRDVVSDLKPLRGAGIYWRGQEGFGGYVAFKLFIENDDQ